MKGDFHCFILKAELNGVVTDQTVLITIEINGKPQEQFCSPPKFRKPYVDGAFVILLKQSAVNNSQ